LIIYLVCFFATYGLFSDLFFPSGVTVVPRHSNLSTWRQDQKEEEEKADLEKNGKNMWKDWQGREEESYQK
jgi:hypothetical protein